MRIVCVVLFLLIFSLADAQQPNINQDLKGAQSQQDAYRKRGTAALAAEEVRMKTELCSDAGSLVAIGQCLSREISTTESNYTAYLKALGALLRFPGSPNVDAKPARLPLDNGEDAWIKYRELGCRSVSSQYEGGDQAPIAYLSCQLKVTERHMEELSELYGDLWH